MSAPVPARYDPAGERGVVNLSSIEGVRGYPIDPVYGALKAAVVHFTKCLGVDVAPCGVRSR
jgi:NAD(P)-dependent dehydrogenase (short-subunit alcohol dehydrogenase family)